MNDAPLMQMNYEVVVSSNGNTLWVNSETSCIGRFDKRFGMDIHRPLELQVAGQGQCLHCTHNPGTFLDWLMFIGLLKDEFGIDIDPSAISFT